MTDGGTRLERCGQNLDPELHALQSWYVALGYALVAIAVLRWWLAYVLLPLLLMFGDFGPPPASGYADMPTAQRAILLAAGGRQIEYVSTSPDSWIWISGVLLTNAQSGVHACAVKYDDQSPFVFAPQFVCPTRTTHPVARFLVNPGALAPGSQTIYSSRDLDIVKLPA